MNGKVFIDTNIFLYAHDTSQMEKRNTARNLILKEFTDGTCAVSTQVLAEFYYNYVVKFGMSSIDALKELHYMSRCLVIDQTISLIVSGTAIHRRHSLSFCDSLILAAAIEASAEVLYTEDMNCGQAIEGVTIVNPFSPDAGS